MKKISIDFDEVLYNLDQIHRDYLKEHYNVDEDYINPNFNYLVNNYPDIVKCWTDVNIYKKGFLIKGAFEFMQELMNTHKMEELQILTYTQSQEIEIYKNNLCEALFKGIDVIHTKDKWEYSKGTILIDDNTNNIVDHVITNKNYGLLFDLNGEYGWNKTPIEDDSTRIFRVKSYSEVLEIINKIEKGHIMESSKSGKQLDNQLNKMVDDKMEIDKRNSKLLDNQLSDYFINGPKNESSDFEDLFKELQKIQEKESAVESLNSISKLIRGDQYKSVNSFEDLFKELRSRHQQQEVTQLNQVEEEEVNPDQVVQNTIKKNISIPEVDKLSRLLNNKQYKAASNYLGYIFINFIEKTKNIKEENIALKEKLMGKVKAAADECVKEEENINLKIDRLIHDKQFEDAKNELNKVIEFDKNIKEENEKLKYQVKQLVLDNQKIKNKYLQMISDYSPLKEKLNNQKDLKEENRKLVEENDELIFSNKMLLIENNKLINMPSNKDKKEKIYKNLIDDDIKKVFIKETGELSTFDNLPVFIQLNNDDIIKTKISKLNSTLQQEILHEMHDQMNKDKQTQSTPNKSFKHSQSTKSKQTFDFLPTDIKNVRITNFDPYFNNHSLIIELNDSRKINTNLNDLPQALKAYISHMVF